MNPQIEKKHPSKIKSCPDPGCDGYLSTVQNMDGLRIVGCGKCRYSEILP